MPLLLVIENFTFWSDLVRARFPTPIEYCVVSLFSIVFFIGCHLLLNRCLGRPIGDHIIYENPEIVYIKLSRMFFQIKSKVREIDV